MLLHLAPKPPPPAPSFAPAPHRHLQLPTRASAGSGSHQQQPPIAAATTTMTESVGFHGMGSGGKCSCGVLGWLSDIVGRRLGGDSTRSRGNYRLRPAASTGSPVASGPSTATFGTASSASISVTKYVSRTASTVSGGISTTAGAGAYCFEAKLADLGLGVRISTERGALVRRRTTVGSGNVDGEVCGVWTGVLQAAAVEALAGERGGRSGKGGGPGDSPGSPGSLGQELGVSIGACMEYSGSLGAAEPGGRGPLPFLGVLVVAGREGGEVEQPGAPGAEGVQTCNPETGSPVLPLHGLEALKPGRGDGGFGGGGRGCSGGGGVNAGSPQSQAAAPVGASAALVPPAHGAIVAQAAGGADACGADGADNGCGGGHGRVSKAAGLRLRPVPGTQPPPVPNTASATAAVASIAAVGGDRAHSQVAERQHGAMQQLQGGKGQAEQEGQEGSEGGAGAGAEAEADAEADEHQVLHFLTPSATRLLALPSLQRRGRGSGGNQAGQLQQRPSEHTSLFGAPQLLSPAASCGLRTRSSGKPQAASLLPPSNPGTAPDIPHLPPSPFLAFARNLSGGGAALTAGADSAHTSIASRVSRLSQVAPSHGIPSHGTRSLSTATSSTASRGGTLASGGGLPAQGSTRDTGSSAHSSIILKPHSSGGGPGGVAEGRTGVAVRGGFAGQGPNCNPIAFPFHQPFYNDLADQPLHHHHLPAQHHRYGLVAPPGGCGGEGLGTMGLGLGRDGVEASAPLPPIQVGWVGTGPSVLFHVTGRLQSFLSADGKAFCV